MSMAASLANNGVLWFPPPKPVEPNLRACQNTLQQTNIVQEWIREHGSDETSDMHLVVQESGVETRIPVSRDVLRITSGLMRGLPEAGDMPVLGEHAASTVVKFTRPELQSASQILAGGHLEAGPARALVRRAAGD